MVEKSQKVQESHNPHHMFWSWKLLWCLQVETKCRNDCIKDVGVEKQAMSLWLFPYEIKAFCSICTQINKQANQLALNIVWKMNQFSPWHVSPSSFIDTYNKKKVNKSDSYTMTSRAAAWTPQPASSTWTSCSTICKTGCQVGTSQVNTHSRCATARSASFMPTFCSESRREEMHYMVPLTSSCFFNRLSCWCLGRLLCWYAMTDHVFGRWWVK